MLCPPNFPLFMELGSFKRYSSVTETEVFNKKKVIANKIIFFTLKRKHRSKKKPLNPSSFLHHFFITNDLGANKKKGSKNCPF